MIVFQVIIMLLMFMAKHPALAFFGLFSILLGIYIVTTLGADGNIAVGYNNGTPINWSDYPFILIPVFLILISFVMTPLKAFNKI